MADQRGKPSKLSEKWLHFLSTMIDITDWASHATDQFEPLDEAIATIQAQRKEHNTTQDQLEALAEVKNTTDRWMDLPKSKRIMAFLGICAWVWTLAETSAIGESIRGFLELVNSANAIARQGQSDEDIKKRRQGLRDLLQVANDEVKKGKLKKHSKIKTFVDTKWEIPPGE